MYTVYCMTVAPTSSQILEPRNITRGDHENQVFIPCPYISRELAPSIWRINGTDYTSATLPSLFSWSPSGLFISEVHRCLNQTSFQCIDTSDSGLQGRESSIGTLTVTITSGEGCTSEHTKVSTYLHMIWLINIELVIYITTLMQGNNKALQYIHIISREWNGVISTELKPKGYRT